MANKKNKSQKNEIQIVETAISEKKISPRGRTFEGIVKKKFHKRIVIEFERMIYVKKYERYAKSRTRIHARLPMSMEKEINIGDLIMVQECRPLSKIIHFIVIKKIKDGQKMETLLIQKMDKTNSAPDPARYESLKLLSQSRSPPYPEGHNKDDEESK